MAIDGRTTLAAALIYECPSDGRGAVEHGGSLSGFTGRPTSSNQLFDGSGQATPDRNRDGTANRSLGIHHDGCRPRPDPPVVSDRSVASVGDDDPVQPVRGDLPPPPVFLSAQGGEGVPRVTVPLDNHRRVPPGANAGPLRDPPILAIRDPIPLGDS